MVWLVMLLFLDLILLGVMIQGRMAPELAVTLALINPLQVFCTAALAMFDPQLIVLGRRRMSSSTSSASPGSGFYALVTRCCSVRWRRRSASSPSGGRTWP